MIPWLALRLLGLRSALTSAFTWATASATRMLVIALCVSLAVQTVRISGLDVWPHIWPLNIKGYAQENADLRATIKKMQDASAANQAAQIAQVKALEAKSAQIAKDADNAHTLTVPIARNLSSAYADAHRCTVRQASVSPASPASQGTDTGVPAEMPAPAQLVGITDADLQTVADLYAYALAAHNQAVDKVTAGQAEPMRVTPAVGSNPLHDGR